MLLQQKKKLGQDLLVRKLREKKKEMRNVDILASINLERAYDRLDWEAMWQVLEICGVWVNL